MGDTQFTKRIWIGFQVVLEVLNNRLSTIGEQKNMFNKLLKLTTKQIEDFKKLNDDYTKEIEDLNLSQRHPLIRPKTFFNETNLKSTLKPFIEFQNYLESTKKEQSDVNDKDEIKNLILSLFKGKIGKPFTDEELEAINKEAKDRYENKTPPGYKDFDKEGMHIYKNQKYSRKYGDLYLWKGIINYAKETKTKYRVIHLATVKFAYKTEACARPFSG